jgi:hypothetical protein
MQKNTRKEVLQTNFFALHKKGLSWMSHSILCENEKISFRFVFFYFIFLANYHVYLNFNVNTDGVNENYCFTNFFRFYPRIIMYKSLSSWWDNFSTFAIILLLFYLDRWDRNWFLVCKWECSEIMSIGFSNEMGEWLKWIFEFLLIMVFLAYSSLLQLCVKLLNWKSKTLKSQQFNCV